MKYCSNCGHEMLLKAHLFNEVSPMITSLVIIDRIMFTTSKVRRKHEIKLQVN